MSNRLQLAALAFLLWSPIAGESASAQPETGPARESEEIETLDDIQEIEEIEPGMGFPEFLGRLHPAVIHFPIAWLVLLLGIEGIALATGGAGWSRAGRVLLFAACISFLPAIATGLIHASHQGSDPNFLQLMEPHRNLNIASAILCLGALPLGFRQRETLRGPRGWVYIGLIAASTLLVLIAGHLGGKMVFGENFLPF